LRNPAGRAGQLTLARTALIPRQHPTPKANQQRTASLPPSSREELASFRRRSASTRHAAP